MSQRLIRILIALSCVLTFTLGTRAELTQGVSFTELPDAPINADGAFVGKIGTQLVLASGPQRGIYTLDLSDPESWKSVGQLASPILNGASEVSGDSLYIVGGSSDGSPSSQASKLTFTADTVTQTELPNLPEILDSPAVGVWGSTLYVAGSVEDGSHSRLYSLDLNSLTPSWNELASPDAAPRYRAFLVKSVETLSYLGGADREGLSEFPSRSFHPRYGWTDLSSMPPAGQITSAQKIGDAHAVVTILGSDNTVSVYMYHMVGDTWVSLDGQFQGLPADAEVASDGTDFYVISNDRVAKASFGKPETNYGWWDHLSVSLYFLLMLWVGFHFAKQSKNSEDYFRGGHKIPWWATGMSLFATGASAMSLMAMPGKSYAGNWTFFAISLYSVACLPIALYFFAPLIRKLNFGTAFEYLENRFGLSVRLIGSSIFAVYQILGRMGGVLLLPSFALEAIAGIPMHVSVPIMGLVTIAYTFLGGLSAVIWTDTLQGLVMVSAVGGCLILVLFRIDMPFSEIWTTLHAQDKLHVFDWGFSLTDENVFTVFIGIVFVTLLGIGDQNFVQRVQCGSSLSNTRKAIITQMAVAVPINVLLFGLGTALFLFYKEAPQELNPVMKNDGIYPFFAAQQLPPGVSGLVIAALLAATMSTISSSICSVSNLAVDDVYKRFAANPTERGAVSVGRIITVLVGLFGIASAFYLYSFDTPSIWDLALRVVSIVTATTVGIYFLGLFTEKANEAGVLVGIIAGMGSTYYVSMDTSVIFWLYPVVGSAITVAVGYLVSLLTGGNKKNIDGLTVYTLQNRKGGLDD